MVNSFAFFLNRKIKYVFVFVAFIVLLKDSNPDVRCRVAEAMHFMYKF
jgi:hypothetical protein